MNELEGNFLFSLYSCLSSLFYIFLHFYFSLFCNVINTYKLLLLLKQSDAILEAQRAVCAGGPCHMMNCGEILSLQRSATHLPRREYITQIQFLWFTAVKISVTDPACSDQFSCCVLSCWALLGLIISYWSDCVLGGFSIYPSNDSSHSLPLSDCTLVGRNIWT